VAPPKCDTRPEAPTVTRQRNGCLLKPLPPGAASPLAALQQPICSANFLCQPSAGLLLLGRNGRSYRCCSPTRTRLCGIPLCDNWRENTEVTSNSDADDGAAANGMDYVRQGNSARSTSKPVPKVVAQARGHLAGLW
jgi:hypothetical protein